MPVSSNLLTMLKQVGDTSYTREMKEAAANMSMERVWLDDLCRKVFTVFSKEENTITFNSGKTWKYCDGNATT